MSIEKALNPIELYYQEYPEERDMSEGYQHRLISMYMQEILEWYYRGQACIVTANLVIYNAAIKTSPDVAVIKGAQLSDQDLSEEVLGWLVSPPERPAPAWVLEVSSRENWDKDIDPTKNRRKYGELGVKEYIAFDPLRYWGGDVRLRGWRYRDGIAEEIAPNAQGWLWSEQLDLWLVPDGVNLWLYDANGTKLPTSKERRLDYEAQRLLNEEQRLLNEEQRLINETQQSVIEALRAKMRANGIEPDAP